jgi:hypothetical protein
MKQINWSLLKSERLKRTRGASFEEIIKSKFIVIKEHPKKENQKIMIFEHKEYVWVVPYVETSDGVFLKTLYPSRKFTRIYKKGGL